MERLPSLGIELHVPAFEPVIKFYSTLGFGIVRRDERYLVMQRGETILCFNEGNDRVYEQSYFKNFSKDTPRGYAVEIIIPVGDVEGFYNIVKDRITIVQPLELKHWGQKDFRVVDPFGFYLRITQEFDWTKHLDQ